jgi:hypothetical protein
MVNNVRVKELVITEWPGGLRVKPAEKAGKGCAAAAMRIISPAAMANGYRPVDYSALGPGEPPKISWVATSGMRDSQSPFS